MHKVLNTRKRKSLCVCVYTYRFCLFLFCGFFFFFSWDRVTCSLAWSWIHSAGKDDLEPWPSWMLRLLVSVTTPDTHGAGNGDKWFVHARKPLYRLSHILSPVCADTGAHMSAGTGEHVCAGTGAHMCAGIWTQRKASGIILSVLITLWALFVWFFNLI